MTQTTKEKRTKDREVFPPHEIRGNTKLRRAWIEAELVRLNAEPNTFARSMDSGSYQHIAVYKIEQVAARVQTRGNCQYCGHQQAIENDVLVLHGFTRPGDGYTHGRCPGTRYAPAQKDISFTKTTIIGLRKFADETEKELAELKKEMEEKGEIDYTGRPKLYPNRKMIWEKRRELTDAENRALRFREKEGLIRACRQQAEGLEEHIIPMFGSELAKVLA